MTGLLHNNSCCEPISSTKRRSSSTKGSSKATTRLSQDQMLLHMINSMSLEARDALSQQAIAELYSKNGGVGGKAAMLLSSSSSSHHKKNKKKKDLFHVQANEALQKDLFHVQANEALPQMTNGDGIRNSNHSSTRRLPRRLSHNDEESSRSARSTDSGTFKTGSDLDSGFYSISIHSSHSCD